MTFVEPFFGCSSRTGLPESTKLMRQMVGLLVTCRGLEEKEKRRGEKRRGEGRRGEGRRGGRGRGGRGRGRGEGRRGEAGEEEKVEKTRRSKRGENFSSGHMLLLTIGACH